LEFPEYADSERTGEPQLPAYAGMAEFWHDYSLPYVPDYLPFLLIMAQCHAIELRSVLDLACGTGTLTAQLASCIPEVVGLDSSEPMLIEARKRCSALVGTRFVQGDFRQFRVDQYFDAAVCAFNSINYVGNLQELAALFRSVGRHLRPRGLFVFDAAAREMMR